MGRSKGRARRAAIDKAFSRGAATAFASANRGSEPRTVALGDAINALTGGPGRTNGLVIDDETRWMMRDPRDDVPFGPINPLRPDAIDPVRPDTKRPEPRLTEYPVAWNLPGSADAPMPWATLRAAAQNVDIMRRCISIRQEQLQGLDWSITLDDQTVQGMHSASAGDTGREDIEAELRRKLLPEINRLTEFWRNPWKANGVSFEQWVNGIMEDHLVLDAVAIYPRMNYGGQLSAFELIDATTIKLLVDYRGARPVAPFPAFQQILYGFPRAEFGSCYATDGEDGVKPVEGMAADQLFYFREQYRSFTPYGYSAVAQALISARLYLRRQGWMLAEYDDGSTPLTFLVPDATDGTMVEKLTPRTRRQWEDSINAELAGQTRARNRMKVLMPGMVPHQMQGVDERYKPDYDMHLIKMLAGHFGVTSTGLGFSESRGLGNSGLHEGQADVQQAATTKPDKRMIERIVNELMCTYQGAPAELRFKFTDPDTEDQAAEDASANAQRARGTITLNDDRKRIGKSPFTFPEADMPMALLGTGWVPIEGMAARAEQQAEAEQALVDDQLANSEAQRDMSAMEAEEVPADQVDKALELAAYNRWARKRGGAARRPFICKALEPSDWPGEQVPDDVDFAEWVWVADGEDIDKAANDNWRTLARDHRGRWVKRGSMRVDALGPSTPDKPVLASLARDAERRRAASAAPKASGLKVGQRAKVTGKDPRGWDFTVEGEVTSVRRAGNEMDVKVRQQLGGEVELTMPADADVTPLDAAAPRAFNREDAARLERQLPVSDASSTMGGMTTPRNESPVETPQQRQARMNEGIRAALSGDAPPPGSMAERIMKRQEQAVRDVVTSLQDAPGGWVAMADVRRKLEREHGMDRGQQDAAIRRLATTGDRALNTAPEDNQKTLTEADHAAAVDFGAGPQHLISLDPPRAADVAAAARGRVSGEDLTPGDRIEYAGVGVTVLSAPTRDAKDKFGREMWQFRARRDDTGAEGPMLFGDGGSYLRGEPAEPRRSVLDTVRESSEQAAAARAAEPKRYDVTAIPGASGARYDGPLRGDDDVMDLIEDMGRAGDGYASLEALRAQMGGTPDEQTAALKRMDRARLIALDPDPLRTTMTPERQAAAVQIGPELKHLVRLMESREPRQAEQAAAASAVIDSVPGLREGVARQQGGWVAANNGAGKNRYFVTRGTDSDPVEERYLFGKDGQLVRFSSAAAAQRRAEAMNEAAARSTSADDPELTTVREEGRQNNPGFALPATPPAAEASKAQRAVGESFDRVAGEFATDPEVAQWRARALDVAGDMDTARGDARVTAQLKAGEIQREFSYAMAGARAAKEARETGGDENAARVEAAESARIAYLDREITRRERQIRDYSGETRKMLRGQLNEVKAQRKAAADRIEAAKPTPAARAEAVAASTPDAPSAAPRDPAELTGRAYRALLATVGEGGRITHPQSRKIVETMERGGWKLADVKPGMSSWAHEDGRRITMLSGADKPTFMADGRKLTGKAALEHVESDHRVTQAAMERVRAAKGLDAQMDAVEAELERPGLREHTRRELEALQARGEAMREAARGPQETPEQRMARVQAEVAQQRAERTAAAQREVARAVEYVGDVMPKTRLEGAELATRLGLNMFNVSSRPDGSFTFALSAPGQSGSARLATFDSARGGWILPGLGGYTFDANDPEFMAAWLYEGTKATYLNDNTKRAHKVSELLREAHR